MTDPGRVTVRHQDGRLASVPELARAVEITPEQTTVRLSDAPGSGRWIEANEESVARLGSWC